MKGLEWVSFGARIQVTDGFMRITVSAVVATACSDYWPWFSLFTTAFLPSFTL
jgi:hypothetical protein